MRTTIDRAGRVVVPKALRDRLGLGPGAAVEISERGGELLLTPVGPRVGIEVREGREIFVLDPDDGAPLTDEDVRQLVDESRQWPRV